MSSKTSVVRSTWRILGVLVCASLIVSTLPPAYARSALVQANVERLASAAQPLKAVGDDQPSTTAEVSDWSQGISLLSRVTLSLQSAVPITYGQTMTGTIQGPGQVVTYTFTASAGDKVLVRMSKSSGTLWPGITVYSPDGTKACEAYSSSTAVIASCTLTSTGTFSILAYDYFGTGTGDYSLYLQRLNNPGSPVSIALGQTLSGSITTPAEMDTYTFTASAGDKMLVRMSISSGTLWPGITVYSPDGTRLCETYSSSTAVIASCTLTSTGTYSILAYDYFGTGTGDYSLYLQRLNNPGSPVPIALGQTLSSSITTPAEMDTYTFAASAGDMVLVRMSKSSGTLWPGIAVYSPDGTRLCETYSSSTAVIASCTLTSTGTYSILAYDYFGTGTSDYSLYLQRLNNPGSLVSIALGQTSSGSITTPAEMDTYTFTASAGDMVLVRMSKSSGTLWPGITVYSPDGTKGCEAYSSSTAVIASCTLTSTGTYSILAYDYFGTGTGAYSLYLQRLNNPGSPVPIALGQTSSGSITTPAEMDTYTFTASAGDMVLVRMSKSSGTLWPGITVYSPDGTRLCETYSSSTAKIISCTLSSTGTYSILAYDYFGTGTGDYSLYLQRNNPGIPVPITFGVPQEIEVTSDLPAWFQIEVLSNTANLFLTLQKYGSWSGDLKLYSGTQVLASSSDYADQILRWPSPTPGKYLVEVSGSGSGRLTTYAALPELPLGQWVVGSILRPWGSAWYQFTMPPGQSSFFIRVETIGLWSQLQVYRGSLGSIPVWSASGPTMDLAIPSPQPGIYYVHLVDSAWIQGSNQVRDHMIKADVVPIEPPPCTSPLVTKISPTKGGTAGLVTVNINGQCLDPQSTVCLERQGHTDVCATTVTGTLDSRTLAATFSLSATEPGNWTLAATNRYSQTATAPISFTVEAGGKANVWVRVVGRAQIRVGREQTYIIRYGNSGSVNAKGVTLWIMGIPKDASWKTGFKITPPPRMLGTETVNWDEVPISVELTDQIAIPLVLPVVPPGFEGELPIRISIPTQRQFQLRAWVDPVGLFGSSEVTGLSCSLTTGADDCIKGLLGKIAGLVPGLDCLMSVLDTLYGSIGTEASDGSTIMSGIQNWTGVILNCAEFLGIGGVLLDAINTAKEIADLLSDIQLIGDCTDAILNEFLLPIEALTSVSPEDKYGPVGYDTPGTPASGLKHWIPVSQSLDYRVDFWNKENAPAATVDVVITDRLSSNLDWSTFKFTEIGFLDWKVQLEPSQYFNVDVNNVAITLSRYYTGQPVVNLMVNAEGSFDPISGTIKWQFHALDPVTRQPPENPYAGFLPPITHSGWEIGWVKFTASPRPGLSSGTTISNQAFVKFDVDVFKPAPAQGPFINTLDALPPVSAAQSPTGTQRCNSFPATWSGQDDQNGSGLRSFDVYADDLGDTAPAYLWQAGTTATFATFMGAPGHRYGFYIRARDNAGNIEADPGPSGYDLEVTAGMYCTWLPLVLKANP